MRITSRSEPLESGSDCPKNCPKLDTASATSLRVASMPRQAFNAYIDEGGDDGFRRVGERGRGVKDAASEWLIMAGVLMPEEEDDERTRTVDQLRVLLNRTKTRTPLHWRDLRQLTRKSCAGCVACPLDERWSLSGPPTAGILRRRCRKKMWVLGARLGVGGFATSYP